MPGFEQHAFPVAEWRARVHTLFGSTRFGRRPPPYPAGAQAPSIFDRDGVGHVLHERWAINVPIAAKRC